MTALIVTQLNASDGIPLTGRVALKHALAKALVAAANDRREVTLSWLSVALDLAQEMEDDVFMNDIPGRPVHRGVTPRKA